jgi:hypothetical protein
VEHHARFHTSPDTIRDMKPKTATLIDNTTIAEHDCPWCFAEAENDVHSPACPCGERYKQIQEIGGAGIPFTFD